MRLPRSEAARCGWLTTSRDDPEQGRACEGTGAACVADEHIPTSTDTDYGIGGLVVPGRVLGNPFPAHVPLTDWAGTGDTRESRFHSFSEPKPRSSDDFP